MMEPFPVCPNQIPPRIGRESLFRQIVESLTKPTPQSLSVVGPRYSGKTVLLKALEQSAALSEKFCCIVYWDLGHNVPRSDAEFAAQMASQLGQALAGIKDDLSQHLLSEGDCYDHLVEVFEMLEAESARVLMLWDGVDRAIGSGDLSRNLWDNLLSLGKRDSLWLITASRHKLQTLIRDAASVTSEFWLLFDSLPLLPMDEADVQAFIDAFASIQVAPGAIKEILNWTGGIPPLVASLLNYALSPGSLSLSPAQIQQAASNPDDRCVGLLESIWKDGSAPACDLFRCLCELGPHPYATAPRQERDWLLRSGMAKQEKALLGPTCRWLQEQVAGASPETGTIARMFGTSDAYKTNIRGILERRLAQLARFDQRLFHLVENSLRELPDHPDLCLVNLTHIEDRAFEVIWAREIGPSKIVPQEWITKWTTQPGNLPTPIRVMMDRDQWEITSDRSQQLAILQLITGSHYTFTDCTAKFATKDAYVLLNAIHCFRNRSQHAGGQGIPLGVAVSGLHLCVELIGCLAQTG